MDDTFRLPANMNGARRWAAQTTSEWLVIMAALPRTTAGKVQKFALRASLLAQLTP